MPRSAKPPSQTPAFADPDFPIDRVLATLNATYPDHPMGLLTEGNPYKVLIACLLSLRTTDELSIPASKRLFELADTPQAMVRLDETTIQQIIVPCGFFRNKARTLKRVSQELLDRFDGQVPQAMDDLLSLHGVGRKTANLVIGLGHRQPAVCVDVHVHRICHRLGYLSGSRTPDETELLLRQYLPVPYWGIINRVMVRHGQMCCRPVSPHCDACVVQADCAQVDVTPRKRPRAIPAFPDMPTGER